VGLTLRALGGCRYSSAIFDTQRWVQGFERLIRMLWESSASGGGSLVDGGSHVDESALFNLVVANRFPAAQA